MPRRSEHLIIFVSMDDASAAPSPTPVARRRDRQAALMEIIETSPDGILVVDRAGQMTLYNRRFTLMWGIPEGVARSGSDSRALGVVLDKLADPDAFLARVRWLYEHPEESAVEDVLLKDGRLFERHTAPLRDGSGIPHGRIWYFRDVTERVRVQRELQRRGEELGLFIAAASHDLRSPLRCIESFGDLLAQQKVLDPDGRDVVARMRAAAERAEQLIDGLVAYASVDAKATPPEDVDLGAVLLESLESLSETIRSCEATIETSRLPVVKAHYAPMKRLFTHILSNAFKFRRPETCPRVRVWSEPRGRHAAVCFRDDGIGFAPEQAEDILRPFIRLHSRARYEGTGLGLAICTHIAERYGGRLEACGRPGEGATFTVLLPV